MRTDWQTIVTLAMGAMALAYVARRWWPSLIGLFAASPASSRPAAAGSGACGQANAPSTSGSCGSGCGNCGQTTTPQRDHRIQIVRRKAD